MRITCNRLAFFLEPQRLGCTKESDFGRENGMIGWGEGSIQIPLLF